MNGKKIKVGAEEIQDEPNSLSKNSKVNWIGPGKPKSEENGGQDEAIKCKHCNGFLEPLPPLKTKTPWYAKPAMLVVGFLTVGPFALPLVWFNPAFSRRKKIIVTVIVLALTYALGAVFVHAVGTIFDYYKQVGIF